MADIFLFRPKVSRAVPEEVVRNFCDWLESDSFFQMKAIVRITSCNIYDLGEFQAEIEGSISLFASFEVQATALAKMPSGDPEPIRLYFPTTDVEVSNLMGNKLQVGSYVIVKGEYSLLINDSPPSLTLYIDGVDDVIPVPEEYLSVVQYWFAD